MVKEIYLANNKGVALVDDEDYKILNQYKWSLNVYGYAQTNITNVDKRISKSMHRLIMNEPKGFEIDHIDQNSLNNQKNNLRIVTHSQNQMNSPKWNSCSSKFKGVSWHKGNNKWISNIGFNNKQIFLGYFKSEIDAAKAYNEKLKNYLKNMHV